MEIKTGEIVLCTVTKIEGTTVFVNIDEYNTQGTIVFSEIAAGRIRNIREYVVPNKKIVCKVLKINSDNIELSFRRVAGMERDEIMNKYKQEQTFKTMLKQIVQNPDEIIKKIKEMHPIQEFIEKAREDIKHLEKFFKKTESEKISKIIAEKKEKDKLVKKTVIIKSDSPTGLADIKEILDIKGAEISYLGSSQFSVSCIGKNFKEANQKLDKFIEEIKVKSKDKKAFFELKEK